MRKIQRFPFTPGFTRLQVMSTYSIQRIVNKLIPYKSQQILRMNILKISFQYSTCTGKETPFRSEMDKTTSSKQTRSSYERKEIKTLVIFRTLFAQVLADSIRTHAYSRIKLRMLPHVFYKPYSSHSACYVWYGVLLVPKNKYSFLRR